MTRMRLSVCLLLVAITLAGCPAGGSKEDHQTGAPTTPTVGGGGPFTIGQGPCSLVIIIQGNPTTIRGDRGSTVSAGGITIVFGPDCSSNVTTAPPTAG